MRILESAPNRYDSGIRIITLGALEKAYDRLATHIEKGHKILDIGCGTGALTLRAAQKGAIVKGIDTNPQMLEIAQSRANKRNILQNLQFCEMGICELDAEKAEDYDSVMSGLCFSELTDNELVYTLKEVKRILKPHGLLLIADEVIPDKPLKKILNQLIRFPLAIVTYMLMHSTTKAVKNLPQMVKKTGFLIESVRLNKRESFMELICKKPQD